MTILGQGEALAGRRSAGQGVDFRSQLQNALTQIALPTLIDSFTARFAKELGVDYLSLDYNSYENLSLTVAKSFGKGLSLQYRRQVSAPSGNQLPRFDLRLTYQPRMKGTFFRHLSFGAGFDQDRPWKLTVEYSFRF